MVDIGNLQPAEGACESVRAQETNDDRDQTILHCLMIDPYY